MKNIKGQDFHSSQYSFHEPDLIMINKQTNMVQVSGSIFWVTFLYKNVKILLLLLLDSDSFFSNITNTVNEITTMKWIASNSN